MNPKYQKVLSDIEKAEKKKTEIEGQLKELYDKKTELENLEIINMILSRLVDTFISRISLTMLPVPKPHNTACVLVAFILQYNILCLYIPVHICTRISLS